MSLTQICYGQGRDTAFAVRKLFHQKRGGAQGFMAAADSALSTTRYVRQDASRALTVDKKPDVVGGLAFAAIGVIKASRYSAENEAFILRQYREGGSIPPDIRNKLRRKHFRLTAKDILSKH